MTCDHNDPDELGIACYFTKKGFITRHDHKCKTCNERNDIEDCNCKKCEKIKEQHEQRKK